MAGSLGSGRKHRPQIEQAYSPVHTRLPSRTVITARRQTFSAGILKAYIDSFRSEIRTTKSGVSLPGILIHLRCCLDSGQMNNIKTTFGGCFAIVTGFSPTNRARQRHWANGQIFSADHAGSMSQILACNRACRYTVQTVITYLGTTKPRYLWCHTAWRGFFL